MKHQAAEELSRLETTGDYERDLEDEITVLLLETTREATSCLFETFDGILEVNKRMTLVLDIEGEESIQMPTKEYFIQQQTEEDLCRQMAQAVRNSDS